MNGENVTFEISFIPEIFRFPSLSKSEIVPYDEKNLTFIPKVLVISKNQIIPDNLFNNFKL